MKLSIHSLELIGAERKFEFADGLNIVSGPIATGKTTLMRCLNGLLAGNLNDIPRETRNNVSNIAGTLQIREESFSVVRPFVTTRNAKVDVAGMDESWRLPVFEATLTEPLTYREWLSEKLGLPVIEVLSAPSQSDSETSPLTINDFLLYCYCRQDELDSSVFGHINYHKNVKRKWVFEVIYGKFNVELSKLYEKRRHLLTDLRRIVSQNETIQTFLQGTEIENRAVIIQRLGQLREQITDSELEITNHSRRVTQETDTLKLRDALFSLENDINSLRNELERERHSVIEKTTLLTQLKKLAARLTRAIVAGSFLLDFDFIQCPRCSSKVSADRIDSSNCYLCLQEPSEQASRADLIKEQDRIGQQISETLELISSHQTVIEEMTIALKNAETEKKKLSDELNFRTESFISEAASVISQLERKRTMFQEESQKLEEYLGLFTKLDNSLEYAEVLRNEIANVQMEIQAASEGMSEFDDRLKLLEKNFRNIVDDLKLERFQDHGYTGIDRSTYLPLFGGRRFGEIQSQGLKVMINVAHALAHQLTCIELDLPLPNFLIFDGLSSNLGYKGLDRDRIRTMYEFLIDIHNHYSDRLQLIVTDNSIPDFAKGFERYEFSPEDKLIPSFLVQSTQDSVREDL